MLMMQSHTSGAEQQVMMIQARGLDEQDRDLKDGIVDESKLALEALSPSTNKVEGQLDEVLEDYDFHEDIRAGMTNEGEAFSERVLAFLKTAGMKPKDLSTTRGRLGKLESKLKSEYYHRANMAAAKASYQHSVSERNKLMMGKIQNESSDMRIRMQSMLMPSATSGGVTYAPASAKVAEQQQPLAQGSPVQEGFTDVEETTTEDAEMRDDRCPPSPTVRNAKRAPDRSKDNPTPIIN
jgi:hypothetical protein